MTSNNIFFAQFYGTTKTNKIYKTLLDEFIEDYNAMSIACLRLASSMC